VWLRDVMQDRGLKVGWQWSSTWERESDGGGELLFGVLGWLSAKRLNAKG